MGFTNSSGSTQADKRTFLQGIVIAGGSINFTATNPGMVVVDTLSSVGTSITLHSGLSVVGGLSATYDNVTATTQVGSDQSTKIATTQFVYDAIPYTGLYSTTRGGSAKWWSSHDQLTAVSADWKSVLATVTANSGSWGAGGTPTNLSYVSPGTAKWWSAHDTVTAASAQWEEHRLDISEVAVASAKWWSAHNTVTAASAQWEEHRLDISEIATTSANWDSAYNSRGEIALLSGGWNTGGQQQHSIFTTVTASSGKWNSAYSSIGDIAPVSAKWWSTHDTVTAQSGDWESNWTTVNAQSGDWESNWSTVNANSGSWGLAAGGSDGPKGISTFTTVTAGSANWDSAHTSRGEIALLSADWNYVATSSANITSDFTVHGSISAVENLSAGGTGDSYFAGNVGIGTSTPDYKLDVAGSIGIDQHIYHNGDANTNINLTDDRIRFEAGNLEMFGMHKKSSSPHQVTVNNGSNNIDFVVKDNDNNKTIFLDASKNKVGIGGVETLDETLTVAGSISAQTDILLSEDQRIYFEADKATWIESHATNSLRLVAGGSTMLTLDQGTGDRAVFGYGTKVYIGYNNNALPTHELEVAGAVSALGVIYASGGDSTVWNATRTTVHNNSADWENTYNHVLGNSGTWENTKGISTFATVTAGSANWDSAWTDVNAQSADWDTTYTAVSSFSGLWESTWQTITATSGDWDHTYTTVKSYSSDWQTASADAAANKLDISNVALASGNWETTYNTVDTNSGKWEKNWTATSLGSGKWWSAHNSLTGVSANWDSAHTSRGEIATASAAWNANSAGVSNIALVSGKWWSAHNSLTGVSANWDSAHTSRGEIALLSGQWTESFNEHITGGSFNTSNGILTFLTQASAAAFTVDLDGRYATDAAGVNADSVYTTVSVGSASWYSVLGTVTALSAAWSGGGTSLSYVSPGTAKWWSTHDQVSALSSQWNEAWTNHLTGATFGTGDGVITLTQKDGGTVTVDIDGRYPVGTGTQGFIPAWGSSPYTFGNTVLYHSTNRLGINTTSNLSIALTISGAGSEEGSLSARDIIYAGPSNSVQWYSAWTTLRENSADWESNWTTVNGGSAKWWSSHNALTSTSANWDSAHTSRGEIALLSGKWNSDWTTTNADSGKWLSTHDTVSATSGNWVSTHASRGEIASVSSQWNNTFTDVNGGSAKWWSAHNSLTGVSANWDSAYTSRGEIATVSGDWFSVLGSVTANSANWDSAYTSRGEIAAVSGHWFSVLGSVTANSASWDSAHTSRGEIAAISGQWTESFNEHITGGSFNTSNGILTFLTQASAAAFTIDLDGRYATDAAGVNADSVYTTVNNSSASWYSVLGTVTANSATWNSGGGGGGDGVKAQSTFTTVSANSANWISTYDSRSEVALVSANWDSAHTSRGEIALLSATWTSPSSSASVAVSVSDANTFSVGKVIRKSSVAGDYNLATASDATSADVVGVVIAATGSDFTYVHSGKATIASHGLTEGNAVFLSDSTPGAMTTTEPTTPGSVTKPLGIAIDSNTILIQPLRGIVIPSSSSGSGTAAGWTDDGAVVRLTTPGDLVSIGTAASGEKLTVAGSISAQGNVYCQGLTATGNLSVGGTLSASGSLLAGGINAYGHTNTIVPDFSKSNLQTGILSGPSDISSSSNRQAGASITLRLSAYSVNCDIIWNSDWSFIGSAPTVLPANKYGILSLQSFGTAETDIIASFAISN